MVFVCLRCFKNSKSVAWDLLTQPTRGPCQPFDDASTCRMVIDKLKKHLGGQMFGFTVV
jgi:hypothetical protein